MPNATARVQLTLAVALLFAAEAGTHSLNAQFVRGTVKSKEAGQLLDRAQVTAYNPEGREMAVATTDQRGKFFLTLKTLGKPFSITVRRLGISPTSSDPITLQPADTADLEFLVEETNSAVVDTFRIRELATTNERALLDAERRGWKMFSPKDVELHRKDARSLQDLLRSWGYAGLNFSSSRMGDCVRSTRTNACLDWVVDGMVVGPNFNMDPRDVYFLAYVNRTEAMTQWGNKTPNGAIVIYTRMNGDKVR